MLRRFVLLATLAALLPATAGAVDSIYWASENPGYVGVGNLDGSGSAGTLFGAEGAPCGVAIDPAAGKIYWANFGSSTIRVGNLDGSGATTLIGGESGACGVAIDHAAGRIYWTTYYGGTIRSAELTGVPGTAATLFPGEPTASGVAIDPTAGKIYWANQSGTIRYGNLDGSGTAATLYGGQFNPIGVAIDPAKNRIYWTNYGPPSTPGAIQVGFLDGDLSGPASTLFTGENGPAGLAIDPDGHQIYWATFYGGEIRHGNLEGSGTASTLGSFSGLGTYGPNFPALLLAPVGTEAPAISSGAAGELTCSQGSWAPDLLGAFLFRAPHSFAHQWLLDGNEIDGATGSTFTPGEPGDYACKVTASNHAGSNSQTSEAFTVSAQATLDIEKFYDANANGQLDATESTIAGWEVQVGDTAYLTPQSLTLDPGDYLVSESDPVQANWLHTTAGSVQVSLSAGDAETVEFGNLCVGAGGALSTGWWTSKSGQALGADDLALTVGLNLRQSNGLPYDPASYSVFRTWLQKAAATNMAYMLSAQLVAMELNVANGKVSGSSLVYAPGTTSANAFGFATVDEVMAEANVELGLHGLTKGGNPYRTYQTALKDALHRANNNLSFVQATPCAFSFPLTP